MNRAVFIQRKSCHCEKLRLALTLGATHTINIDEDNIDHVVAGLQLKDGFDICLEMSGNPDAYPTVFEYVKPFGEIVLMGVPDAPQTMDWRSVIFKQLTVKGDHGRSCLRLGNKCQP